VSGLTENGSSTDELSVWVADPLGAGLTIFLIFRADMFGPRVVEWVAQLEML
jgi:hypothetical protein